MKTYLYVFIGLSIISFLTNRVLTIIKATDNSKIIANIIGFTLELAMSILAIVFVAKL